MDKLFEAVKAFFEPYQPLGHDFKHAIRTAAYARQIAKDEGYDENEAWAAGLLHDVGRTVKDSKIPHGHEGAPIARGFLNSYTDFSEEAKERIGQAIYVHSEPTTEGKLNNILQDADKLDGMGAIGLTRSYMSMYSKPDYEPHDIFPKSPVYGKPKTANEHFMLQVNWYHMLYTETAKKLGKPRYELMKAFMEAFEREVAEAI